MQPGVTQPLLPELPHLEPLANFAYANGYGAVDSIALSPDGSVAWFTSACPTIDVARALDLASRGLLYAQLALAAIVLAFGLARILRRPRTPGHPHCRRCNYDLSGQALTSPCAECGVDPGSRRPIIGRTAKRRLRPWIIATAVLLIPAVLPGGPAGLLSKACSYRAVYHLAAPESLATRYPSLIRSNVLGNGMRLFRADLASGSCRPILTKRRSFETIVVCPDGQSLIMSDPESSGVARIDGKTGRALRKFQSVVAHPPGIREPLAIGFTPDGNGVYVQ